jgi:hypothetical protein
VELHNSLINYKLSKSKLSERAGGTRMDVDGGSLGVFIE